MEAGGDSLPLNLSRALGIGTYGLPSGWWRWAAMALVLIAVAGAGLAIAAPQASGSIGLVLVGGIGAIASIFLYAVWPHGSLRRIETRRVAEAAARANVAWAITGADGAVLDCNDAYRHLAGIKAGGIAPPPELALATESSAANLYRLTQGATQGKPRDEVLSLGPGMELVGAVRPLKGGQAAWWFTPRLAAPVGAPQTGANSHPAAIPASVSFFHDAPIGVA